MKGWGREDGKNGGSHGKEGGRDERKSFHTPVATLSDQSINQSKQIYTAPCVALGESNAITYHQHNHHQQHAAAAATV